MDTDAPGSAGPAPKDRTALVRRRRTIVLTGLLGGLAVAVAALAALPSAYTATTTVQVRPPGAAEAGGVPDDAPGRDLDIAAEVQLAGSELTAAVVSETRGEDGLSPAELADRVHVEAPSDGDVLEIAYTAPTPEQARDGADGWAEAYLATRAQQTQALLATHLEALRDEQEVLYAQLTQVEGDAARTEALQQEVADLSGVVASLTAMAQTADPGTVVDPADTPGSASAPSPLLWLFGGPAAGLALGLAAAYVRDRLDPRVRDGVQAARLSGSPVLMEMPVPARLDELLCEPFDEHSSGGQRANACAHLLRSRLGVRKGADEEEQPEGAEGAQVVLVTSVTPGRSGPRAAVDLSAALARTGSETLLVCADPSPAPLGLPEGPGLAEALVDGEDPGALTVRPDSVPRLRVLRHGRPGTSAPVQATVVHDLLELLRPDADHTVLTSTAGTGRADVEALMGVADALVPVVELGRSRREDLASLVRAAELSGTAVPGVVVLVHADAPEVPVPPPASVPASEAAPAGAVPACRVAEHDRAKHDPSGGGPTGSEGLTGAAGAPGTRTDVGREAVDASRVRADGTLRQAETPAGTDAGPGETAGGSPVDARAEARAMGDSDAVALGGTGTGARSEPDGGMAGVPDNTSDAGPGSDAATGAGR
ncbi:hypothetical protein IDM40_11035 [Nocardiopsis sp. HNM0947]|uniref:Chain length determinant protein n=1 Tax=Nocardiopsis coralli TaxID=2772213 RepID=A0ABR9P5W0_9ACTN|nr:hypothetical protein [Nocardiopsis coralli]MBE2999234.1 hypothetical protein [Nocardiopsis coralli]